MTTREGLVVTELTVRFGGLVAVHGVGLEAPVGRITGLIGPNGAGKTTTFNACTGLVSTAEGTVLLFGHDVTRSSPSHRAQLGLGRTFQRMEIYDRMTVAENVAMGREALLAGQRPWAPFWTSRHQRRETEELAAEAIDLCGIGHLRDRPAGLLSTGQKRLVELARAVAGSFRLLLLDEPSSGLDHSETDAFGEVLLGVTRSRGTGILLVEHDMSLIRNVCDYAYVLDFGALITQGPTDEVLASDAVRAAYLGTEVA
jgi:ABC-type branched-subunit amino acid transport system ATPase component